MLFERYFGGVIRLWIFIAYNNVGGYDDIFRLCGNNAIKFRSVKYESGKGQSDRRNPGLKSELVLLRSVHLTKNF